jgi:hypothetical protein
LFSIKCSAYVPGGALAAMGAELRIHLDEDDAPNPDDRETAERVLTEIMTNDVISRGSFMIEGYSAARRIAQALAAARADERRIGFSTPFRMRQIKSAPGAPAVMAQLPQIKPLHHWLEVGGVRFQSYRIHSNSVPLISDDGRIRVDKYESFWVANVDGKPVMDCGLTRQFETAEEAIDLALKRLAAGWYKLTGA